MGCAYGQRTDIMNEIQHTDACYDMPSCLVCHRPKAPFGRDPGVMMAGSLCGHECPGYNQDPKPGHFWPDEKPGFEEPTS